MRDAIWKWGLELDAPRQARRALNAVARRDPLRAAVNGRRVLITGASAGIGRETALRVADAGGEVLLVARRRDRLDALARETGGHVLPCDLTDLDAVGALTELILDEYDGVDVLVNNAGHSIRRALWRQTDRLHDFDRVMRLNYLAAVHLTLPLVERMRQRGRGQVINVSTMGTQFGPEPRFAGYLASKAALDAFARSASAETGRDGVRWTTVHMPLVRTEMIAPTKAFASFPALSAQDGAAMVCDGIARRPARVTHPYGVALHLVDLALPRFLEARMGAAMGRGGSPVSRTPESDAAPRAG